MHALTFGTTERQINQVLCLGAHPDDIEIGCGGTLLKLLDRPSPPAVHWIVFSSSPVREREAFQSASALLSRVRDRTIAIHKFRDGFFPYVGMEIKECFEQLKLQCRPDLIFTHYHGDLHQDHRLISQLTWNTFRDHLIFEYEIPKYDGDLKAPNAFVPLDEAECDSKIRHLLKHFKSQAAHHWFSDDLFRSLLRLRGMECNAGGRYAEAFYCRKVRLDV